MPSRAERSPYRFVAPGLLVTLLVLAAIPAYLAVQPAWQSLAIRLACGAFVVAGSVRIIRRARRSIEEPAWSAPAPPPSVARAPVVDESFLRLRRDVTFSVQSRRYFDAILWPRLLGLAGADLPRPVEERRLRRRGPSLRALERLIGEAERRA